MIHGSEYETLDVQKGNVVVHADLLGSLHERGHHTVTFQVQIRANVSQAMGPPVCM